MLGMSEKSWRRRIVPLLCGLMLALALALVGCSRYENPAKVPFASDECAGMSYSDVLSQLEEAGFTNVQTTQTETTNKDEDGQVISVTINGESDYKASSTWEGTSPVEIIHYDLKQISTIMHASVSGEAGEPIFDLTTNLPDDTKLVLTLQNGKGYKEEQTVSVARGHASSQPFKYQNSPLEGEYTLTVEMKPSGQAEAVLNEIGTPGECLTGELIQQDTESGNQYLYMEQPYIARSKIDVSFEVSAEIVEGEPIFTVKTNLPDNTILTIEISDEPGYFRQQDVEVKNGMATGVPFEDWDWTQEDYYFAVMVDNYGQPDDVAEIIGEKGEYLAGPLVNDMNGYFYAQGFYTYDFANNVVAVYDPDAPSTKEDESEAVSNTASEDEMRAALKKALSSFGDNCEITLEGYLWTASVWGDGLAQTAFLASLGNEEAYTAWAELAESARKASGSLQELLEMNGYGNYMIQLNILNDLNRENVLLSAMFEIIMENCVS